MKDYSSYSKEECQQLTLRLLTSLDLIYRQDVFNKEMRCERLCCLDQN